MDLSVVVLTMNEEKNLPACLESIKPLGCEIFVLDSGSTDRTLEIAEAAGARIFKHPFENYGAQRNWSQANLPLKSEWVLHVDADERVTPELRASIINAMANPAPDVKGFMVRRRTIFLGRTIRHGGTYPTYHARLYRLSCGRCEDRLYDQHFVVDGATHRLRGDLIDTMSDLATWTARHVRWAIAEAKEISVGQQEEGRMVGKLFGNPIQRRRWLRQKVYYRVPLFVRPFLYFFYRYFIRLGFLDGQEGLVYHFLQGCWYRFQVDAVLLEKRLAAKKGMEETVKGDAR